LGVTLDVERSQVAYGWAGMVQSNGGIDASGMVVAGGAAELDRDVPEVAAAVYDRAGRHGQLAVQHGVCREAFGGCARASRAAGLQDVEDLVAAGIPVVLSVHAPALRGAGTRRGHLVLGTGFSATGDVVVNDP
jgi:hypothetical protein